MSNDDDVRRQTYSVCHSEILYTQHHGDMTQNISHHHKPLTTWCSSRNCSNLSLSNVNKPNSILVCTHLEHDIIACRRPRVQYGSYTMIYWKLVVVWNRGQMPDSVSMCEKLRNNSELTILVNQRRVHIQEFFCGKNALIGVLSLAGLACWRGCLKMCKLLLKGWRMKMFIVVWNGI